MNEDRFGELSIVLLRDVDAFPGQGLQDPVVILIVIIRIRVYIGQREAVELRIGKGMNDLRFQMLLFLWTSKFISKYQVIVENIYAQIITWLIKTR